MGAVRRSSRHRRRSLLVVVPLQSEPAPSVSLSFAIVWALVGVSLVVLTGWGGNISLGQFGIVGVGAMVAGNLIDALRTSTSSSRIPAAGSPARSSPCSSACPRCASAACSSRSRRWRSRSRSTRTSSTPSTSPTSCPASHPPPVLVEAVRPLGASTRLLLLPRRARAVDRRSPRRARVAQRPRRDRHPRQRARRRRVRACRRRA